MSNRNAHTEEQIKAIFAGCETLNDLRASKANMMEHDPILQDANHRKRVYNRLKNERAKEIEAAELAPFEDEAKRMKHGQKVYFGSRMHTDSLDWNFRFNAELRRRIEKGDWCYVWQYQPRAKRLWLCKPGKPCKRENVFPEPFSIRNMRDHGISRTEPSLR